MLVAFIAIVFLVAGASVPRGTAVEMGPGYFPALVAWLALAVGALMIGRSLRVDGPGLAALPWRAFLATVCAVLLFGLCVARLGLLLTAPLTLIVAALGSPGLSLPRAVTLIVLVTAGTTLVFVQALGLTIPLLPGG